MKIAMRMNEMNLMSWYDTSHVITLYNYIFLTVEVDEQQAEVFQINDIHQAM